MKQNTLVKNCVSTKRRYFLLRSAGTVETENRRIDEVAESVSSATSFSLEKE